MWEGSSCLQKEYPCAPSLVSGTVQDLSNQIMSLNETARPAGTRTLQLPSCFFTAADDSTQELLVHFQQGISPWAKQIYSSVYLAKILLLGWGEFHGVVRFREIWFGMIEMLDIQLPFKKRVWFTLSDASGRFLNRRSPLPTAIKGVTC